MPRVGFEPMISVFERPKKFHALDCATTVTGIKTGVIQLFVTFRLRYEFAREAVKIEPRRVKLKNLHC
jgi:hypothetical protein